MALVWKNLFSESDDIAYIQKSLPNSVLPVGPEAVLSFFGDGQDETILLGKFVLSESDETWKYNKITNAYVGAWAIAKNLSDSRTGELRIRCLKSTYNPDTVTWANAPQLEKPWSTSLDYVVVSNTSRYYYENLPDRQFINDITLSYFAKQVVKNGFALFNYFDTYVTQSAIEVQTGNGELSPGRQSISPGMGIQIDDEVIVTSKITATGKTSGYYSNKIAQTFSWFFDKYGSYYCIGDWTQVSAVFHWRSGTSGSWNDIPISGATQSVTIPANTFPIGTIQWYVSGVDNVGTASDSEIYTITTADSPMVATPLAPIGTVEDGSGDIVFSWQEANDTGTTPTGADLQYSQDGSTWTAFGHVDGAVTTYTAPGGTLPAGAVMWRVRAYNTDGVAGAWSEAVSFVSVAAPPAPTVSAAAVPFTTVTWQSSGQQAYRITVDGVVYGPFFGTDKNYALKDYLRDGDHTISVEIQGIYGLWSQPGAITITVANSPGDGITLTGSFDRDAALRWETESATMDFLVYRDGKQIGATATNSFSDRFVLGSHSYQVINRLANGNYTASNVVTGVMRSCTTAIAPFNGGSWQELNLSENSYSEQRFSWTKVSSLRHVTGAVYPVLEISEYENAAGSYDVSFPDVESANAFLALRGQIVILKSRGGNVVIGALTQIEKANKDFYISFAFTIQRIDWEDYVDAQNS